MQVCTSLQADNHASTTPLNFLQAGCPSCRPTNSIKALKAIDTSSRSILLSVIIPDLNFFITLPADVVGFSLILVLITVAMYVRVADSDGAEQQPPQQRRQVIVQRDEKGYGFTVEGANPVFIQTVKESTSLRTDTSVEHLPIFSAFFVLTMCH